jgi:hypothetical protein
MAFVALYSFGSAMQLPTWISPVQRTLEHAGPRGLESEGLTRSEA